MPGETTVHLIITGRVQGVGFRAWCKAAAEENGLSGWVRNRRDGSVEAVAHGATDHIETFITACRQGPAFARVDEIVQSHITDIPPPGFEQRATA